MQTIETKIAELQAQGLTLTLIRAHLLVAGFTAKEIKTATKNLSTVATGLKAGFYAFLLEAERSEKECRDYIDALGSDNATKKIGSYLSVAKLAQDIRALASEEKSYEELVLSAAFAFAVKIEGIIKSEGLTAAVRKKYRGKVHPDKVAHFGNAELTAIYNKLSQKFNA